MKKLLSLLLILIMVMPLIIACNNDANDTDNNENGNSEQAIANVSVLNGTTGFGIANLMEKNANNQSLNSYNFKIETDASVIVSGLIAGNIDIAALPTNAAANVYNKTNGKVQIMAINTLGVLYLIQKGNEITDISKLNGKTVYVPAQNPTFITKHIFQSNNINATIDSTTYSSPAALQSAVIAGAVEYAILPQPVLTAAMAGAKNAGFEYNIALDLTEEWNKIPGSNQLVQGCIVVRKEFAENNKQYIENFLKEYEESIKFLNENNKEASELIQKHGIFAKAAVAEKAIPKCNITYIDGEEMKSAMSAFISAMYDINPDSVGNKLPLDDFYFIKQ